MCPLTRSVHLLECPLIIEFTVILEYPLPLKYFVMMIGQIFWYFGASSTVMDIVEIRPPVLLVKSQKIPLVLTTINKKRT